MQELVPVVIGVALGVVAGRRTGRWAWLLVLGAAPVLGVLVAWAVGELAESVAFAALDTVVVALTACIVVAAKRLATRREMGAAGGGVRWLKSLRMRRM